MNTQTNGKQQGTLRNLKRNVLFYDLQEVQKKTQTNPETRGNELLYSKIWSQTGDQHFCPESRDFYTKKRQVLSSEETKIEMFRVF